MYRSRSKYWMIVLAVFMVVMVGACADESVFQSETPSARGALFRASTSADVQEVLGEIGPGAKYGLFVPADWNGDLVLYAHGFKDPASSIDLPVADHIVPLRDALVALGYAVAYSSYSENGLSVKDGAIRTRQLRGIFASTVGEPDRTYLLGHSLGGLVAIMLAEKNPAHYAGVLPMCGMIGGSKAAIDYFGHLRTLFDFFYPTVLPGNAMDIPEEVDLYTEVILPVIDAIQEKPERAGAITAIQQTPVPFTTGEELVESFVRGIGFQFRGFEDVLGRTHGHIPFGNMQTEYMGPLPEELLAGINAGVNRFDATRDALTQLKNFYEPSGALEVPVLTLHNEWDPVVPLFHEDLYAKAVAAAGKSHLLRQRTVGVYGHCKFGEEEAEGVEVMVEAFLDLVAWSEEGIVP